MVAPLPPALCDEAESHFASTSDACDSGTSNKEDNVSCPSPADGSASVLQALQVPGSASSSFLDDASGNDAQGCAPLISNEVCKEGSIADTSEKSVDATSLIYGHLPVHSGSFSKLPEASQTAFMPNLHHVAGSTSRAELDPREGPLTGVMSISGMRPEMEDSITVALGFSFLPCKKTGGCLGACLPSANEQDGDLPLHFFGVYDGHGGSQVSNFCKERLHVTLAKEVQCSLGAGQSSWEQSWEKTMRSAFCKIDAEIEGYGWRSSAVENTGSVRERVSEPLAPDTVGSTAIVAVIGLCQIVVANCGDSRAVLSRGGQAIAMSDDHKPNREDEMARIEAAGGRVIYWNGYRIFGVLAMSRAIGDRYLKPYVIAEPEVKCISRSKDDECLILASDGLWDVLTNEEVCDVARKCLTRRADGSEGSRSPGYTKGSNDKKAEAAAALLTKMALGRGSQDNISVIVIDLKNRTRS